MPPTLTAFSKALAAKIKTHHALVKRKNKPLADSNGVYQRFVDPVITADHIPLSWRYDLNPETNPYFMERLGVNAAFNPGAFYWKKKFHLVVRVEGVDRKSFFAIAESDNGVDNFRFWPKPILLPQTDDPDTNVYDMRIVFHEDGNIYGLFCAERKDPKAAPGDTSSAVATCGIVRTKDFVTWERLPDLKSKAQQRNVVLHPEFIDGKYALYTRPSDAFVEVGTGGGIGWALVDSMENAATTEEKIFEPKVYHTIKEVKNGTGPAPIKTPEGWLHIAHGVRNTAAGLRYTVYAYLADLKEPWKVTHRPAGHLIAVQDAERVGDVSNVIFSNGAIALPNGELYIYYASSDTRCHVAKTSISHMIDYCKNTPEDPLRSHLCVEQRIALIEKNEAFLGGLKGKKKEAYKGV